MFAFDNVLKGFIFLISIYFDDCKQKQWIEWLDKILHNFKASNEIETCTSIHTVAKKIMLDISRTKYDYVIMTQNVYAYVPKLGWAEKYTYFFRFAIP